MSCFSWSCKLPFAKLEEPLKAWRKPDDMQGVILVIFSIILSLKDKTCRSAIELARIANTHLEKNEINFQFSHFDRFEKYNPEGKKYIMLLWEEAIPCSSRGVWAAQLQGIIQEAKSTVDVNKQLYAAGRSRCYPLIYWSSLNYRKLLLFFFLIALLCLVLSIKQSRKYRGKYQCRLGGSEPMTDENKKSIDLFWGVGVEKAVGGVCTWEMVHRSILILIFFFF